MLEMLGFFKFPHFSLNFLIDTSIILFSEILPSLWITAETNYFFAWTWYEKWSIIIIKAP